MSGNVSEWVARDGDAPGAAAGEPEEQDATREACGGNWTSIQPASASVQWSVSYDTADRQDRVGLRCALGLSGDKAQPVPKPKPVVNAPFEDVTAKSCPKGMIEIRPRPGTAAWNLVNYPFCIDQYEYPNEAGKKPRTEITWHAANKLARDAGFRLATFQEWQVAAGGEELWAYPSGNSCEPGRLAVGLGADEGPVESGSRNLAESPFRGIFDLNGNVADWIEPRVFNGIKSWGVMGGCWISAPDSAKSSSWEAHPPDFSAKTIGFRRAVRLEK
jgi:formylglycine-generating enzyme required for sulfatase activity